MRRAFALAVTIVALVAMGGCADGEASPTTSLTWEQSQAIPDFDGGPGEVTDADQLARFDEILEEYDLAGRDVEIGASCPGSRTTDITYETEAGEEYDVRVDTCEEDAGADAIDSLVTEWRTS